MEEKGADIYKPNELHNFSLYLEGKWYSLTAKPGTYDDNDPIGVLDVTISSNLILDEILGIKDLRSDKRIDFVGGIRGGRTEQTCWQRRNESGIGFHPVSAGNSSWTLPIPVILCLPKLLGLNPNCVPGLVIHKLV